MFVDWFQISVGVCGWTVIPFTERPTGLEDLGLYFLKVMMKPSPHGTKKMNCKRFLLPEKNLSFLSACPVSEPRYFIEKELIGPKHFYPKLIWLTHLLIIANLLAKPLEKVHHWWR